MKIKILYEDQDILAVDKPSGILVHPDQRSKEKTILDLFTKKYPKIEIVHRLDKDTSGVMLLAKNQKAFLSLKSQFVNKEIKKTYVAIINGWVKNDHGIINKPIGRSPSDFRRRLSGRGARGEMREAITEYKVLKRFEIRAKDCNIFQSCALPGVPGGTLGHGKSYNPSPVQFTYLEIYPKTGRTHQIRVHLKYINHPVVCDSLYNPNQLCPKNISRLALHAKSIEFKNLKDKIIKVVSPIPKEFTKVVK